MHLPAPLLPLLSASAPALRTALAWTQRIILPLSLGVLLYFGWQTRDTLLATLANANPNWLIAAVGLWLACHLLAPVLSLLFFHGDHIELDYRRAFWIHAHPLPSRYLPGGVWHTVGRVAMLHKAGASRRQLTSFLLLENALAVAISLGLGSASLAWFGAPARFGPLPLLGMLGAILVLIMLPVLLKRGALTLTYPIPVHRYLLAIVGIVLFWITAASAFACFTVAIGGDLAANPIVETGGIYLISWGIGYLSIFTPQGIGVFEWVAGSLMNSGLGLREAMVLIAGFRAVVFIADILAWLGAQWLCRQRNN